MHFLTEGLHKILLGSLVKLVVVVAWRKRRRRHRRFVTMVHGNGLRVCTREGHHPLDSFDVRFVLFALLLLSLPCFALGCLSGCASLQFTGHELEVVRDFDTALQEEQFEVTGFVLELDLVTVLQRFADSTPRAKHGKDLTPVWSLYPI